MADPRDIPSVDHLLNQPAVSAMLKAYGHDWCVSGLREILEQNRQSVLNGQAALTEKEVMDQLESKLHKQANPTLKPVINATGVVLHTNLGRAPLSASAIEAIAQISQGYSTLEYDLEKGSRGKRDIHAADLLTRITGAEAGLVVNNNAGGVMLSLAALANRKKVAISRSQLVEIGGGFRIPEVMRLSGAKLLEIGTTNRTHLSDYETALEEGASLILVAHQSNFKIVGFTSAPTFAEVCNLAHASNLPVVFDLGSGALIDPVEFGLKTEMTVQQAILEGADIVCFSGDKLLGGPQAGLIVGKQALINKIRKHPFYRALRADKLCLSALTATLLEYLKGNAVQNIPVVNMLSQSGEDLKKRAQSWQQKLKTGDIVQGSSAIGGGSLPEQDLPTWLLSVQPKSARKFAELLRKQDPAVIARIEKDQVLFDPRTVLTSLDEVLLSTIRKALSKENNEKRP